MWRIRNIFLCCNNCSNVNTMLTCMYTMLLLRTLKLPLEFWCVITDSNPSSFLPRGVRDPCSLGLLTTFSSYSERSWGEERPKTVANAKPLSQKKKVVNDVLLSADVGRELPDNEWRQNVCLLRFVKKSGKLTIDSLTFHVIPWVVFLWVRLCTWGCEETAVLFCFSPLVVSNYNAPRESMSLEYF